MTEKEKLLAVENQLSITIVYTINNFETVTPTESLEDKVTRLELENEAFKIELAETQSIINDLIISSFGGM